MLAKDVKKKTSCRSLSNSTSDLIYEILTVKESFIYQRWGLIRSDEELTPSIHHQSFHSPLSAKATWLLPLLWPKEHRRRVDVWSTIVRRLYLSNTSKCCCKWKLWRFTLPENNMFAHENHWKTTFLLGSRPIFRGLYIVRFREVWFYMFVECIKNSKP